jgi:hypothetical protein
MSASTPITVRTVRAGPCARLAGSVPHRGRGSLPASHAKIEERGIYLPVLEVGVPYLKPARDDDVLDLQSGLDARLDGGLDSGGIERLIAGINGRNGPQPSVFLDHVNVPAGAADAEAILQILYEPWAVLCSRQDGAHIIPFSRGNGGDLRISHRVQLETYYVELLAGISLPNMPEHAHHTL